MRLERKAGQSGNSVVALIPHDLADMMGIKYGTWLEYTLEGDKLCIRKLVKK